MTKYTLTTLLVVFISFSTEAQENFDYNRILTFMSDVGAPNFESYQIDEKTDFFEMPNGEYFLEISSTTNSAGFLMQNKIRFYSHDAKFITYYVTYNGHKIEKIKKTVSTNSTGPEKIAWNFTPEESVSYSAKTQLEEKREFLYYFYWAHSFNDKCLNMSQKN